MVACFDPISLADLENLVTAWQYKGQCLGSGDSVLEDVGLATAMDDFVPQGPTRN